MDPQLLTVLAVLAVTVVLIVTEWIRIDVVAVSAMLVLVWTGSLSAEEARSGFSSNAVFAIIGVMIMSRGLFASGVTEKIANFILRIAGSSRRQILATVSTTVGVMSGFMQNIGAAALFLPVMTGISKREGIPISSLLMPMGFAALLGGTITMVGTSSLIVLNDLLSARGLEPFSLFSVTPIGIVLLITGILYFFLIGGRLLPEPDENNLDASSTGMRMLNVWGLSDSVYTFEVPESSPLVGKSIEESEMGARYNVNLLRAYQNDAADYNIWENHQFEPSQNIVVQGRADDVETFAENNKLSLIEEEEKSSRDSDVGYLEVVIPARSNLVGKTIREMALRETYNAQVVLVFSDSKIVDEGMADRKIRAGDTLVLQGPWESLQFFEESEEFITVTPLKKKTEEKRPEKAVFAVSSFAAALGVVLLLNLPISIGFMSGAVAMVLGGVMTMEDAYRAVEWKVIFLIAGLIPLGIAMESSGAAALIAETLVGVVQGTPPFIILLALGLLTTVFSLFMSNVAATVLMVPLVLELTGIGGLTSQVLVLQVGLCAANSFLIPTHHVNALLMTPGGYRVPDYLRVGGILTGLFITVSTSMLYFLYL